MRSIDWRLIIDVTNHLITIILKVRTLHEHVVNIFSDIKITILTCASASQSGFKAGSSHLNLLALHIIFITFCQILITPLSASARCHHVRFLVSCRTSLMRLLSLWNKTDVVQYKSSLDYAFPNNVFTNPSSRTQVLCHSACFLIPLAIQTDHKY